MREKKPYMVISFHTTADAMAMEKLCAREGVPGRIIPVPREITAGCGLAWRIPQQDYPAWSGRLETLGLNYAAVTPLML